VFSLRFSRSLADKEIASCYPIGRQKSVAKKSFLYIQITKLCFSLFNLNPDYQSEYPALNTVHIKNIYKHYDEVLDISRIFLYKFSNKGFVFPRLRYVPDRRTCLRHHLKTFNVYWANPFVVCYLISLM
jgi:hypothetical protein